jgi:L-lactate dehydrogenase complex protein LldG
LKVQSNLEAIDGEKVSEKQIPQAGLTGARAAIAETGTLVLPEGDGRSPLASLLPDIHLAVIDIHDLYPNLSSILHLEEVTHSPSTILISGPSRTADIEMTLTIGVHGPKEIYVFCVDDQVHQDQI